MGEPVRIMLIEDNEDHAYAVKLSFSRHRVANKIYRVADGEAALDFLFRRNEYADPSKSPRPHVIFLDLRLPKIDGLEVLRQIKESEQLHRIPIVILTTSAAEQDLVEAYDCHVNSYLVKPLDFEKFTELMKAVGFYWLAWNSRPSNGFYTR